MLRLINSYNIRNSIKLTNNNINLIRKFSINSKILNEGESEVEAGKKEFKKPNKFEGGNDRKNNINNSYFNSTGVNKLDNKYKRNFITKSFDETSTFRSLKALEPSVVVLVLDLLDLDNSIPKGLNENLPPNTNLIVTANHIDSLKDIDWQKGLKNFIVTKLKLCKLKWKGTITLIDTQSGIRVEALKSIIKRYNEGNNKVTFLGPRSSNLRQLIESLHAGSAFETKKLTIPIIGSKPITINSYIPVESTNPESIKFSSNYLNIKGERPSYLDLLDPAQIKTVLPRGKGLGKLTPHNFILPNTTLQFDNLLKLEYYGTNKLFLNNFTLINPKYYPIFDKEQEPSEDGKLKFNDNKPIVKGMKFTNQISLPLNLPNKFEKPETVKGPRKGNKYSFDISLPGLGWLSFNTNNLERYEGKGFIKIYTLNGLRLPISRARLPNWNSFDGKAKKVVNKSEGEEKVSTTTTINEGLEHNNDSDNENNIANNISEISQNSETIESTNNYNDNYYKIFNK